MKKVTVYREIDGRVYTLTAVKRGKKGNGSCFVWTPEPTCKKAHRVTKKQVQELQELYRDDTSIIIAQLQQEQEEEEKGA